MTIRPLAENEKHFCYTNSQQICAQTGCIGHLRADFGSDGGAFYSTWWDHQEHLNDDKFKESFQQVIEDLRSNQDYGLVLENRYAMRKYCANHPVLDFGNGREYGIRVDTDIYTYLLRLNPNQGEYNLYCYCYVRYWLDRHLEKAKGGIRFIDSKYNELFRIPDAGKVTITSPDGTKRDYGCMYLDDYHLEFDWRVYHICELAEKLERAGEKVAPAA